MDKTMENNMKAGIILGLRRLGVPIVWAWSLWGTYWGPQFWNLPFHNSVKVNLLGLCRVSLYQTIKVTHLKAN